MGEFLFCLWIGFAAFFFGKSVGRGELVLEALQGQHCKEVSLPGEKIKKCYKLVPVEETKE